MSFTWPHSWGRLPDDVRAWLQHREWDNTRNLRKRLTGERPFPIKISLQPPSGKQALADIAHFHHWLRTWREFTPPAGVEIQWQSRQYRELTPQHTPTSVSIQTIQALIDWLGKTAIERSQHWVQQMQPLLAFDERLYPGLIRHLETLETLTLREIELLVEVLPQLQPGLGSGNYLRALPLRGIDTKFVEVHRKLLEDLLNIRFDNAVSDNGGLLGWLDCHHKPNSWLWVRPLCENTCAALAGLSLLQLDAETLQQHPLPGTRVLVVENLESGYALPQLPDTVAVFGGGKNVAWLTADWLQN